MEVIGPFAAPFDEHGDDGSNEAMDWTAQIAPSYFNNRKVSIYGGSNEIQRNIITKAVLGVGFHNDAATRLVDMGELEPALHGVRRNDGRPGCARATRG